MEMRFCWEISVHFDPNNGTALCDVWPVNLHVRFILDNAEASKTRGLFGPLPRDNWTLEKTCCERWVVFISCSFWAGLLTFPFYSELCMQRQLFLIVDLISFCTVRFLVCLSVFNFSTIGHGAFISLLYNWNWHCDLDLWPTL